MENAANKNSPLIWHIEDHVFPMFYASKSRMDRMTVPSQPWHFSNAIETFNEIVEIQVGLLFTSNIYGVVSYFSKIELCQNRETILVHAVSFLVTSARRRIRARTRPMTSPSAMPLSTPA
jgi:hypothetical protein